MQLRLSLFCFFCVFFVGTAEARQTPAQDKAANEKIFQGMLHEAKWQDDLNKNYFESILSIYYRMEWYQREFHREIKHVLEKQKSDPAYQMEIGDLGVYRKLIASRPVSERVENRILYVYRRLLETITDAKAEAELRARAYDMVSACYHWFGERSELDKLLVSALMDRLAEVQESMDLSEAKVPGREMAALSKFDFKKANFNGEQDLSLLFARHDTDLSKKAKLVASRKDADFDRAIAAIGIRVERRRPAGANLVFKPSTGPEGTFGGRAMEVGTFAQTFDDGPSREHSDRVMHVASTFTDSQNPSGIPLTFFWQVINVKEHPDQLVHAKKLNYLMNNHSWDHPQNYGTLGAEGWRQQVTEADSFLRAAFGQQPVLGSNKIPFYRCPFGECIYHNKNQGIPEVRQLIADLEEIHILWNIDSNDWAPINQKNPFRTATLTIDQMKAQKRGIILMHDIWPDTPVAFSNVLEWVKDQNDHHDGKIRFISIKQAIEQANAAAAK